MTLTDEQRWAMAHAERLRARYLHSPDEAKRAAVADLGMLDLRRRFAEGAAGGTKAIQAVKRAAKVTGGEDLAPPRAPGGTEEADDNQVRLIAAARDSARRTRPGIRLPDRPSPASQADVLDQMHEIAAYTQAPLGVDPAEPQDWINKGVSREEAAKIPTPTTVRNELEDQRRQLVRMGYPVAPRGGQDLSTYDGAMDAQSEINRAREQVLAAAHRDPAKNTWARRADGKPTERQAHRVAAIFDRLAENPDSSFYGEVQHKNLDKMTDRQVADYIERLSAEDDRMSQRGELLRAGIAPADDATAHTIINDPDDPRYASIRERAKHLTAQGFGPGEALYAATFSPVLDDEGHDDLSALADRARATQRENDLRPVGGLPPTDAQIAALAELTGELSDLGVADYNHAPPVSRAHAASLLQELAADRNRAYRASRATPTEDGLYVSGNGMALRVKDGKTTVFDPNNPDKGWADLTGRAENSVSAEGATPMTESDAQEFGKASGRCMVCNRPLTGASARTGIGPKCRTKFGAEK